MYLPGYSKAKCVCKQCFESLIPESMRDSSVRLEDYNKTSIESIISCVARYLYKNQFYYPYSYIHNHISHGEVVYKNILQDVPLQSKQEIIDLCWYFYGRASGKNSSFLSGIIFIEDKDYKVFRMLSLFGYPRCFPLHSLGNKMQFPVTWTLGSTHLASYIDYCIRNSPWSLPEQSVPIQMSHTKHGIGYDQVGIDLWSESMNEHLDLSNQMLPFAKRHILIGKIPLKHPSMSDYIFIKMESYGTGSPTDIIKHTLRYGVYLTKEKHTENTRREEIDRLLFKQFEVLLKSISTEINEKIIKIDIKNCLERAKVKGVSTIYSVCKDILIKINTTVTKYMTIDSYSKLFPLYERVYKFVMTDILTTSFNDHLTIRFGQEVILDQQELLSSNYICSSLSMETLPFLARPRGYSISTIKHNCSSFPDSFDYTIKPFLSLSPSLSISSTPLVEVPEQEDLYHSDDCSHEMHSIRISYSSTGSTASDGLLSPSPSPQGSISF